VSSTPPDDPSVIDTVVIQYFLLVGRADLLLRLLGTPLRLPRVVFDPDEPKGTPPLAMSELSRAIDYYERRSRDPSRTDDERVAAAQAQRRLALVRESHARGDVEVVDMTEPERTVFAALTDSAQVEGFGLSFPLDPGEAACVAIALTRAWTIVTDDDDALTAVRSRHATHPYERIRRLLVRAARSGFITEAEANAIHTEMTNLGFWDRQVPFTQRRQ
jgi:hypothetical protein